MWMAQYIHLHIRCLISYHVFEMGLDGNHSLMTPSGFPSPLGSPLMEEAEAVRPGVRALVISPSCCQERVGGGPCDSSS